MRHPKEHIKSRIAWLQQKHAKTKVTIQWIFGLYYFLPHQKIAKFTNFSEILNVLHSRLKIERLYSFFIYQIVLYYMHK